MTVMTHVKALQAGHSSQGTSEPITPVHILYRLCSFGNAKVGEAKVGEAKFGEAKVGEAKVFFFFFFGCTVSRAGKAKVHTNIFEKAKIGEQNNLIMGNKYRQTIIF